MDTLAENNNSLNEERTLKGLSPHIAAMLCYVGGWISGVILLVLEHKNRVIRFHALQSIIVFGILAAAMAFFGSIPVIGRGFSGALGLLGFILWIILIVKALNGEYFKMPWAGELAEHWANESFGQTPPYKEEANIDSSRRYTTPPTGTEIPPKAADQEPRQTGTMNEKPSRQDDFRARYYSLGARAGRLVGSAFAIAWSVVLLVFFTFYNQYIAYYEPMQNGTTTWQMHTLVTNNFVLWLPILTTTLVLTIVGHALLIAVDKYILLQLVRIVLSAFGAATVITLLVVFPFNFAVIPNHLAADAATGGTTALLVLGAIGFIIGALVRFIKLIVQIVEGHY